MEIAARTIGLGSKVSPPKPSPGHHEIERIDQRAVSPDTHWPATVYQQNPACDSIGRRDDAVEEARGIARVATARAMNFVRTSAGEAAMRGSGDRYIDVLREYVNSALAQRCNPIRVSGDSRGLHGTDKSGNGVSLVGNETLTKVSLTRHHVNDANMKIRYGQFGIIYDSIRARDGTYGLSTPYQGSDANYIMRYHGALNSDESMTP